VKTPTRLAAFEFSPVFRLSAIVILATLLTFGGIAPTTLAAPGTAPDSAVISAQNVDWMSAETAASLDLPMDVLVPTWIPAPFDQVAPSISASGGYYELYWMISGGSPTFLYITGTVGGGLPAGSPANLNNELSINASVQGWDAIHDIGIPEGSETPIYDQVWWIANGVLYSVSSNNMTGTDTMSLANSLVVLVPPAGEEPPAPPAPTDPPYVEPAAPAEETPRAATESGGTNAVSSEASGSSAVADTSTDSSTSSNSSTASTGGARSASGSQAGSNNASGGGESWSPGRYDSGTPSDGTNGPLPPLIGTDGTGGAYDTALPNIFFRP